MITSFLILAGNFTSSITLPPDLYSYGELASKLSVEGKNVSISPKLGDRLCIVSLKDRSWDDAVAALSAGLAISVEKQEDGGYLMKIPEAIETSEMLLLREFCGMYNAHARKVAKAVDELSKGKLPPDGPELDIQITKELGGDGADKLLKSKLSPERAGALAVLSGLSNKRNPELAIDGRTFDYLQDGLMLSKLIPSNFVEEGSPFYWRDRADLPAWARDEMFSFLRPQLDKTATPQEANSVASRNSIVHKIGFSPNALALFWSSSTNPSGDQNQTLRTGGSAAGFSLPFTAAAQSELFDKVGQRDALKKRAEATRTVMAAASSKQAASKSLTNSITSVFLDWCRQNEREVVMEISSVRDRSETRFFDGKTYSLLQILHAGSALDSPLTWSLREDKGVLIVSNEFAFLDHQYVTPGRDLLRLARAGVEKEGLREPAMPWEAVLRYARDVDDKKNATASALNVQLAAPELYDGVPIVRLFDSLDPARKKEVLAEAFRTGQMLKVPMKEFPQAAVQRFVEGRRQIYRARIENFAVISRGFGGGTQNELHPATFSEVQNGFMRVMVSSARRGAEDGYEVSLTVDTEIRARSENKLKPTIPSYGSVSISPVLMAGLK